MLDLHTTKHGAARMRQRGFRKADIELIVRSATHVADGAFFLTDRDASREIARRKQEIQQLERLRGSQIIIDGDRIVTLYHAAIMPKHLNGKKHRRPQ